VIRALLLVVLLAGCTGAPAGTGATATTAPAVAPSPIATAAAGGVASAAPSSITRRDIVFAAECKAPATPTSESTEGPYFKAGSPEKSSLVTAGMEGTRILLIGSVLTKSCKPVAGAKVDIWQANAKGEYDNSGYALRGYVRTDANGQYRIETIVPGEYPGRTPHIHVKVEPPGGKVLTTQLYMPNVASNARDSIFRTELVLQIIQGPPLAGAFVFVVDLP
jgi:protocatechuate 3,4-dioxygenase beta subunit